MPGAAMSIESQADLISKQLLDDLRNDRRMSVSIADVQFVVAGRVDGLGYDRGMLNRLVELTFLGVFKGAG
jgi:hypothetical protein